MTTTREEFEELVRDVVKADENLHWNERIDAEDEYTVSARDASVGAWSALLAVYDTQAARIAELEWDRDESTRLYDMQQKRACDAEARITELEAALRDLTTEYQHVVSEHVRPPITGHASALDVALKILGR